MGKKVMETRKLNYYQIQTKLLHKKLVFPNHEQTNKSGHFFRKII